MKQDKRVVEMEPEGFGGDGRVRGHEVLGFYLPQPRNLGPADCSWFYIFVSPWSQLPHLFHGVNPISEDWQ